MHYYKRNIGDYSKKAGRLNILQHGVYNLLIDACYDREIFPTREEAIDWIWAESDEEIAAVDYVLKKFFQQDDEGRFIQNHIREDLDKYHNRSITQTENGKKGGRPKKAIGNNGDPDDNLDETQNNPLGFDGEPNETQDKPSLVKPLTTNHKPLNQEPLNNNPPQGAGADTREKMLVDAFVPDLDDVNIRLKTSGHKEIDATLMLKELARFKDEYSKNSIAYPENWYLGRFSSWIMTNNPSRQPGNKSSKNNQSRPSQQLNRNVNDAWPDIPEHAPAIDNTVLPEDFV